MGLAVPSRNIHVNLADLAEMVLIRIHESPNNSEDKRVFIGWSEWSTVGDKVCIVLRQILRGII